MNGLLATLRDIAATYWWVIDLLLVATGLIIYVGASHSLHQRRHPAAANSWGLGIGLLPYIPPPPYPPLARRMGEEGKVVLRVAVTPQGSASEVQIHTSSGSTRLDESAQKTVRNWKFIPAKQGDTAVSSWVLVPIIFKLEQ